MRHAPGTSSFAHQHGDIAGHLTLGLAPDAAVKLSLLRLTNQGTEARRLTLTTYMEWTLGVLREHTQHQVHTRFDRERETLLATNYFDPHFTGWTAFHAISEPVSGYTAGRRDFIGRNRSVANPAALLDGGNLSGITGAGIDPCAALQCTIELDPGETREIAIVLGAAPTEKKAIELAARVPRSGANSIGHRCNDHLVDRPALGHHRADAGADLRRDAQPLVTLSGALLPHVGPLGAVPEQRSVWVPGPTAGRDGIRLRRPGDRPGAHHPVCRAAVRRGRRATLVASPQRPRRPHQILRRSRLAAVRRRSLPAGHCRWSVLDELAPFLTMRQLEPDEHEIYDLPGISSEMATVYQHCVRALRRACTAGEHGLPLIGIGDWNDGMNRVGIGGKARACGWPGSWQRRFAHSPSTRSRAVMRRSRPSFAGRPSSIWPRWTSTAGMGSGIAAPTSTMARRWIAAEPGVPDRFHRPELEYHIGRTEDGGKAAGRPERHGDEVAGEVSGAG